MLRSCGNTSTVLTIKYYRVDRVHSTYHLDTGVYQRQGRYRFTSSGIWLPFSISLLMYGRCTTTAFLVISLAGTASSNSKARTSVKTSAFILRDWVSHRNRDANEKGLTLRGRSGTRCTTEAHQGSSSDFPTHRGHSARPPGRSPTAQA